MNWLLITPSKKTNVVECTKRIVSKHAFFFADRTGEEVSAIPLSEPLLKRLPSIKIPIGASLKEKRRLKRVQKLRAEFTSLKNKFFKLPKKGSFSGLHFVGEIERVQNELVELGDAVTRYNPEITIELG